MIMHKWLKESKNFSLAIATVLYAKGNMHDTYG